MAHSTDLQRTNTTVFDGLRALAKASLAALAGGVLLSGAAMAQVTVQPTVYDFTPIVSSPGDLEPGDTLQVEFTISADAPVFVEDNLDGTSDWTSTVYSAMSTSVSLSGLGSGAEVVTFSGTTGASGGVATLINGNCNGTGPSFGASTASWSSMDTGSVFFNSFSAPTCTVAVTFKLPDDIAPGAYTLNFGSLTGVQRTADILADGSNPAFFFSSQSVTLGAPSAFSASLNSAGFTVVADTTGPSGTINAPSGPVAPGEVFSASIVFDEPIIGFDSSDISVGNGTLSNFVAITDESGAADSFTFDVTAGTVGTVTIDVAAAAGQDAAGNDSSVLTQATTTVAGELQISATFLGDAPAPGDTTTLRLTIENTDASEVGTISSFTSNLQENLTGLAAALPASTNTCGSSPSGTTFLIVTGGTVAASSSCIIEIPVTVPGGAAPDTYPVRTSNLSFSYPVAGAGVSDAAVTQLTVAGAEGAGAPLAFSKSFTDDPVLPGGTVTLEYTIVPEEGTDASSLAFSDDLDAALSGLVATGLPQSDVCGTGSTLSGTSTISLSGGNIADGATCTFSVTLQTPTGTSGDFVSSTSELTGNQDGGSGAVAIDTGAIASDTLTLINQVPQVVQSGPAGPVAVGEGFTLTVEFSEPVTGFVAGDLIVTNGSASNLQTSDNETFTVTITPAAAGTVTVELPAGVAQDTDTNGNVAATDYTVEAETAAPEIEVQFVGSSLALTDGSATASTATGTDFGVVDVTTGSLTRTLRITNSGVGALSVTSIALTDTTNFGLTAALPTSVAGGGGTLDVPVTFDPTSVATFPATITINSDDADEAAFDFAISGEGGAAPEINVTGNSVNIADGDTSVTAADHTQFETIDVSATGTRTFTIENQGGSVLTLGANAVSITNDPSGVFSVSAQPATTVAASGSETFTIQFTPSDVGTFTGLVNIASDDASENPYTFAIEATATGAPEVDLQGNGVSIVSGDVTPAAADDTSFEGVALGSNASATFTIRNTGNDELVLTPPGGGRGDPVVRGAGSTDFTVTAQPGLSIAAGGSETFSIQYAPSTAGVASATFQFGTNDDDEATYSFTVGGEGTEKEIAVGQGATDFTSGVSSFEFVDNTGSAFNGGTVGLDAGTETVTFTISNVGSTTLNLGANAVSLSGAGSGDFSVTSQPATTVAPAGSTNFEITFDPSAVGDRQATVSVANDDSDESPFTFDINGFGVDLTPPAAFSKGFAPATVSIGGTSTLTFTIDNSGGLASASGLDFTDNMPSGMTVAAVPNASTTCTGGTLTAAAGTGTITYTGGTVSGAATCTVSVDVTGGSVGSLVNTTGDLTSNQGNSGTASDTLTVTQPSVSIADVTVSEGDGTADFTVSLSAAPSSTTTVDFATADGTAIAGSDYTAIGGTVTFLAGQTSQTVSVVITDDTSDEPTPETFTVTLSSPTNADLGSPSTATGSINDNDDAPEISIADASISENGGTVDFAVSLSNPSASSITVDFATADGTAIAGSDYVATSGTLTFNPGDTADTITVTITDDGVVEPSETFTVDLSGATNSTIVDGSATGTITNDDAAPVGYTASFDADPVNNAGASATSFTLASAVVGTTYDFTISSDGGGTAVTGSGSVTSAGQQVSGIDVSGLGDGTLTLSVTLTDTFGNEGVAATDTAQKETTIPGVVISTTSADPVSGVFEVTFTFDEDVTGFATGDITVGNGSVTRFATTSASIYSAEITPTSDGTVTVDVAAGVAEDAAGNLNTAATQFSIESDATRPSVEITTASADPVSGVFEVTFTFTEDVTGFVVGDITVGNGSAGNFQSTSASVYTADITPAADGAVTVDVAGGAAADAAGNTNTAATQFSIESDGSAPTVVSVVVSDADLRVGDVGTPFTVEVTFSEALDPAGGVLSFDEDLNPTLTLAELAMSGGNTVLTFTFDVADTGLFRPGVDVLVSEFADPAGNVMALSTTSDVFSIDLRRAGITVTQDVLGLVDAEFDYSGDLGVFTVTTSGQTGSEVFTDLVEGSYAITLAEEAGFSITDIACTGGSTAIDLPNRTATVTLAPADAVQCNFEATADPGIDEINVPDVALTLPNVVGDPTGVTTSFALTNTGGAPFAFNASTDQPWLAIDPTSGSIPAASDLTFTLSFTDAVLALAPGEYTANIIITEAAPAGPTSAGASTTQSVQNITIPVSITITPREGTLTLVATTAPSIAGEGVFTYSSDIGALDGLSLSTINGTASSDGVTVLSGTYAITQAVSEGWRLDSISCTGDTDNGSTFDVDTGTATIDLDPEETMVCTFANRRDEAFIREVTQSAIRSFMAARADQILNASPDVGRRLRTDRATATPNSFAFDMTEGRLNASMSMSLSAIRQAASERENRMPDQEAFSLAGETGMASVDVWVEASYASVSDDRAGLNADTDFGMYAIGVDMMVSDDMLIGVLAQFDQAETITGEFRSQVEGDGWLAGPYMAARLSERMVFDARVAWGQSDNQVNPIGTYWDDFETSRWLAEANLVGDIINGAWRFSPGVGIAYFSEEQKQYTDSLGFVIPSQEITLGRITAGPEIAYRFETPDGGVFEPFVKVTAVYDYDDTEVINLSGQLAGLGNFRADARVGLAAEFANGGRLSAEAMFSGVGEGDFEATTGMIRVRLPLSLQ